ncbi:unnamed protein product [Oikopleura dioica]|uniref:Uncharacterized protein n=1 Tax=Oikopleura dioica TaxID=34765 RepID=E4YS33_OIKDI|nr:unnamed protein product [Oikopleura dioica]
MEKFQIPREYAEEIIWVERKNAFDSTQWMGDLQSLRILKKPERTIHKPKRRNKHFDFQMSSEKMLN